MHLEAETASRLVLKKPGRKGYDGRLSKIVKWLDYL